MKPRHDRREHRHLRLASSPGIATARPHIHCTRMCKPVNQCPSSYPPFDGTNPAAPALLSHQPASRWRQRANVARNNRVLRISNMSDATTSVQRARNEYDLWPIDLRAREMSNIPDLHAETICRAPPRVRTHVKHGGEGSEVRRSRFAPSLSRTGDLSIGCLVVVDAAQEGSQLVINGHAQSVSLDCHIRSSLQSARGMKLGKQFGEDNSGWTYNLSRCVAVELLGEGGAGGA
jgi:hypothetical protein